MGVALRQTSSASRPSRAGGRTARTAAAAGRVAGTERWVEPFFAPAVACCCSNESMRTRASIPRLVIVDHEMRYRQPPERCVRSFSPFWPAAGADAVLTGGTTGGNVPNDSAHRAQTLLPATVGSELVAGSQTEPDADLVRRVAASDEP